VDSDSARMPALTYTTHGIGGNAELQALVSRTMGVLDSRESYYGTFFLPASHCLFFGSPIHAACVHDTLPTCHSPRCYYCSILRAACLPNTCCIRAVVQQRAYTAPSGAILADQLALSATRTLLTRTCLIFPDSRVPHRRLPTGNMAAPLFCRMRQHDRDAAWINVGSQRCCYLRRSRLAPHFRAVRLTTHDTRWVDATRIRLPRAYARR